MTGFRSGTNASPGTVLCVLRTLVGVGSWLAPATSARVFGLGRTGDDPRAAVVTRLFAARETALALALRHPSAELRRGVLRAGLLIDGADLVSSVLAARDGGPRAQLLLVGGGAGVFVALAAAELRGSGAPPVR